MKEMVKALHDAGIGVIMDVVYNHTAENDGSNFELTAPDITTAIGMTADIRMHRAAATRRLPTAGRCVTIS